MLRRNRLRWFGHTNRMLNADNEPSVVKKMTFSYFHGVKHPRSMGVRNRWEDKVLDDIEHLEIRNWRRQTMDRKQWKHLINKKCHSTAVNENIKGIIFKYRKRADERRAGVGTKKSTEILTKGMDNQYRCPECKRKFKPQVITNHVKSCASAVIW